MVEVEERFMMKELYKKGISISELARQSGHDRKTIRAIVNGPLSVQTKERRAKGRKLDPYRAYLERRIGEGVLNAQKLYQELLSQGYTGKARSVRRYVEPWRAARQRQATVRFETEPGQQAQVDWGSFGTIEHEGRQRRLYGFVMTLGWSRMLYLEFTVSADLAWWLRCHIHAFHYFGGVPREMLHDNLKTAVLAHGTDGVVHWQPRYLDFAHYYGFTPRACQPYRAQTKGKVESGVRYVRGNFWLGLHFSDLADLNEQRWQWLNSVANVRVHGTTQAIPVARLPLEGLQSLAGKADYDTSLISYRRSTKDCLVSYQGNYYSIPAAYAQQQLLLKENEQGELFVLTLDGCELARHRLAVTHQQRIVLPSHYAGLTLRPTPPPSSPVRQQPRLPLTVAGPAVEIRPLQVYEQWLEAVA
jgi:transposase